MTLILSLFLIALKSLLWEKLSDEQKNDFGRPIFQGRAGGTHYYFIGSLYSIYT